MTVSQTRVAPLKKVHVEISLSAEANDPAGSGRVVRSLKFIYGVGSSGLSGFEFKLAKAGPGDKVELTLDPGEWESFFGHLPIPWPATLPQRTQRRIQVAVQTVETPQQKEIIQALAAATACGSGCCGNH